jgi:hypothetical protein
VNNAAKTNPPGSKSPDPKAGHLAVPAHNIKDSEIERVVNEIGVPLKEGAAYVRSFRCKAGESRDDCLERMVSMGKKRFQKVE